jgi:RimJ/RimL family protein N-acetyltransferase|nr:hypothetical protein 1 [Prochloraceae cyanobacterium]BDD46468.1 hypothetical protein 14 [bacterium]
MAHAQAGARLQFETLLNACPHALFRHFSAQQTQDLYTPVSSQDVGWRINWLGDTYSAKAQLGGQVVAACHLAPIILNDTGVRAVNLSYSVQQEHQGMGLAFKVCSQLLAQYLSGAGNSQWQPKLINVQTPGANHRSCALAARLGLRRDPERDFFFNERHFHAFSGQPLEILKACLPYSS